MKKKRKKLVMFVLFLAVFALLSPSPFDETKVQKTDLTGTTKSQPTTSTVYEKAVKEEVKTTQKSKPNSILNIQLPKLVEKDYTGESLFSATDGAEWDELKQMTTTASAAIASISVVFLVLMKQKRQRDDEHYE